MDGVIFIRTLSDLEESILERVKADNKIATNTKTIQFIMTEYNKLSGNEEKLKEQIKTLKDRVWDLEKQLEDYEDFFSLFNKLAKLK